jgi:hypothetical protein
VSKSQRKRVQSGGPKTDIGKLRASRNSRKLGLFAKEFDFSSEQKADFEDMEKVLREGLTPDTSLLELLFADVVACCWRMKLALRGEQQQLTGHSATQDEKASDPPAEEFPMYFPYKMTPSELRRRLKSVEDLEEIVSLESRLDSRMEEPVSKAFGAEFWKMLQEFTPENITLLNIAAMGLEAYPAYGMDDPSPRPTPEQEKSYRRADSCARIEMRTKFVQLEKLHLQQALRFVEQTGNGVIEAAASSNRLDLFLRYATTTRRDFYRTLRDYLEIKKILFKGHCALQVRSDLKVGMSVHSARR